MAGTLWESPLWSRLGLKIGLRKGPTPGKFGKNGGLQRGLMLEKFEKDCLPWEGPYGGAGEECGVLPLRRKERQRQGVRNPPQPTFPIPLRRSGGEEGERTGSGVVPGKKGGVGEGVLRFGFISHYPTLI